MRSRRGPAPGAHGIRRAHAFLLLLALVLATACAGALCPAPAVAGVDDAIAASLRQAGLHGAGTGVYVWDLDAALPVYELNAGTSLTPASNLKIVTSAAAILDWGVDHRFVTELCAEDVPVAAGGVLQRRPLPPRARRPEPLDAGLPAGRVRHDDRVVRDLRQDPQT